MNRERIKSIIIVVLVLTVLIFGMMYIRNRIYADAYSRGLEDATSLVVQQIINDLNANGFTTIWVSRGNETVPVRLGVIS